MLLTAASKIVAALSLNPSDRVASDSTNALFSSRWSTDSSVTLIPFNNKVAQKLPLTHGREYTEQEMWDNLEYWIKIITPIAEEEGIKLGIHPCDPPVEKLGGIPMLFRSFESYKRLIEIYPSFFLV